jgi:organic hydroperoxide reductase OsmC/OhrA
MSEHRALVTWSRTSADFTYMSYNRDHLWKMGETEVPASAAPGYRGDAAKVNPEDALVAALSSCHMLTFLAIAAKKKLSLDSYEDEALGLLEKNAEGKLALTRVTLRPKIVWTKGAAVSPEELSAMHHAAHEGCFIANSVKTDVIVEPRA